MHDKDVSSSSFRESCNHLTRKKLDFAFWYSFDPLFVTELQMYSIVLPKFY